MIGFPAGGLSLRSCHLPLGCCDRARAEVVETLARVVQGAQEQVHVTPMSESPGMVASTVTLCPGQFSRGDDPPRRYGRGRVRSNKLESRNWDEIRPIE